MSIVTERLNANKPPPQVDSKTKLAAGTLNNNKDLDVDVKKEEPSFFNSFFSSSKASVAAKKKGVAVMDAVCVPSTISGDCRTDPVF
jgi:hypothetical protein